MRNFHENIPSVLSNDFFYRLPSNYMTNDVIEATNQCLIAQADDAERNMLSDEQAQKQILEEFGRCLVQIIECSTNAMHSSNNT